MGRVAEEFAASSEALRGYARHLGADPTTAEDAVAEAFATVLAFAEDRLIAIQNLRAYLYTTTRHLVRRAQTAASRAVTAGDEMLDRPVPDEAERLAARSSLELARKALDAVDEKQRAVLLAMLVEDRTPAEAGRLIGVTASNASTILHRARVALRFEYVRAYLALAPPACGLDVDLLAKVVTDRAGRRDAAAYRRHASTCTICPRLARGAREELRSGSLLAILLLVLVAGSTLARPETALALSAPPEPVARTWRPLMAAGSLLALAGLTTMAFFPVSSPPGWSSALPGLAAPSVRITAEPARIELAMPAPGDRTNWSSRVTSSSTTTVAVSLEIVASERNGAERPRLLLSRDGVALAPAFSLSNTPGSMSIGTLEPGGSLTIEGVVLRDPADTDQSLSAGMTIRVWASSDLDAAGPPGRWTDAGGPSELPATGTDPRGSAILGGIALAAGLAMLGTAGAVRRRRVRAAQPPAAGGVCRDSASSST